LIIRSTLISGVILEAPSKNEVAFKITIGPHIMQIFNIKANYWANHKPNGDFKSHLISPMVILKATSFLEEHKSDKRGTSSITLIFEAHKSFCRI